MEDFKVQFALDSSSAYFQELYRSTRVYDGELNQVQAVTDRAEVKSDSNLMF